MNYFLMEDNTKTIYKATIIDMPYDGHKCITLERGGGRYRVGRATLLTATVIIEAVIRGLNLNL